MTYVVVVRKVWCNLVTGQKVSIHGSLPYRGDKGAWEIVEDGFTIYNRRENTYGVYGLVNVDRFDRSDVQALCDTLNGRIYTPTEVAS